jgi:hypothetical protein
MERSMVALLAQLLLAIRSRFTRRAWLEAENLLLRQQLVVLRRKSPKRVRRLRNIDRLLLVWLYRLYPSLLDAIIIVQFETVIGWHRRGFRPYWRWKSRHVGGRPRVDSEMRGLIRRMSRENPLWGPATSAAVHGGPRTSGAFLRNSKRSRFHSLTRVRGIAPQNYQLLAQDEIFGLKPRSPREPRPDSEQQLGQKRDHRPLHYHTLNPRVIPDNVFGRRSLFNRFAESNRPQCDVDARHILRRQTEGHSLWLGCFNQSRGKPLLGVLTVRVGKTLAW